MFCIWHFAFGASIENINKIKGDTNRNAIMHLVLDQYRNLGKDIMINVKLDKRKWTANRKQRKLLEATKPWNRTA